MDDTFSAAPSLRWLVLAASALTVMTAVPGCAGFRDGTTARSFINRTNDPDPNVRYQAYIHLGNLNAYDSEAQRAEAVKTLVAKLNAHSRRAESVASRAVICRALGNLGDPAARPAILKAIDDQQSALIRQEACRALGKLGLPEDATLLCRIMAVDPLPDSKVAAMDGLAQLKPKDTRVLRVLVEAMDDEYPCIRLASLDALKKITDQDLGIEPGPWKKYVQERMAMESGTSKPDVMQTKGPSFTRGVIQALLPKRNVPAPNQAQAQPPAPASTPTAPANGTAAPSSPAPPTTNAPAAAS